MKEYFRPDGMLYWLKHMPGGDAPARRRDPKAGTVTYENDPQLLAIVARKMAGKGRKLTEEMVDLTHLLREDGRLIWDGRSEDVPGGLEQFYLHQFDEEAKEEHGNV